MYNFLLYRWRSGNLSEAEVTYAVTRGWITQEQADMILATPRL